MTTTTTMFAVSKNAATSEQNGNYAFVNSTNDMILGAHDAIINWVDPDLMEDVVIHISDGTTTIITDVTNYASEFPTQVHVLPPLNGTLASSLNVVNMASVGQLKLTGLLDAPVEMRGGVLDQMGMIRADDSGIFYCCEDYDGTSAIWKKLPFEVAPKVSQGNIGYNSNRGTICGIPTDKKGDLRTCNGYLFVCTGIYNGDDTIWTRVSSETFNPTHFSLSTEIYHTSTSDPLYPSGHYLTFYALNVVPIKATAYNQYSQTIYSHMRDSIFEVNPGYDGYIVQMASYGYNFPTGWRITLKNISATKYATLYAYAGSGNTFDGQGTLRLDPGQTYDIVWTGAVFKTLFRDRPSNWVTLTSAASINIDASLSDKFALTMNMNSTIKTPTNMKDGDMIMFKIIQGSATLRTISWSPSFKWVGGVIPVLTTGPGKMDIVRAYYSQADMIWISEIFKDVR